MLINNKKKQMISKIEELNKLGFSDRKIERLSSLGNATINRIRRTGKYRPTTEKKVDRLIITIINKLSGII